MSISNHSTTRKSWRSDAPIILPGWECHTGGSRSKPTVHRCRPKTGGCGLLTRTQDEPTKTTQNHSCLNVFVPMSLGLTSVPKHQILKEKESLVYVFHYLACSLFCCHCSCRAAVCSHDAGQSNSSLSLALAGREKLLNTAQGTRSVFLVVGSPSDASLYDRHFDTNRRTRLT